MEFVFVATLLSYSSIHRASGSSIVAVGAAEADAVAGSINLTELHDDGGRVELICKG
jgi:hypothetical protein